MSSAKMLGSHSASDSSGMCAALRTNGDQTMLHRFCDLQAASFYPSIVVTQAARGDI